MCHGDTDAARTEDSPAVRLLRALNGLSFSCSNAELIESEAERRHRARDMRDSLLNAAAQDVSERVNRKVVEGAPFEESITEITAFRAENEAWSPPPATEEVKKVIGGIADDLATHAAHAEQAVREGGAADLDNAMSPNSKGQPRSIELAHLFDDARSLSACNRPCVRWLEGEVTITADEAVNREPEHDDAKRTERAEAIDWLRLTLADGPMLATEVKEVAKESQGIAPRTLERAKKEADVEAYRPKNPGPWFWRLPDGGADRHTPKDEDGGGLAFCSERSAKDELETPAKGTPPHRQTATH